MKNVSISCVQEYEVPHVLTIHHAKKVSAIEELGEEYSNNGPVAQELRRHERIFNKVFNGHKNGEHDNTGDQTADDSRVIPRKGVTAPAYTEQETCRSPNDCKSTKIVESFQSFHELEIRGFET